MKIVKFTLVDLLFGLLYSHRCLFVPLAISLACLNCYKNSNIVKECKKVAFTYLQISMAFLKSPSTAATFLEQNSIAVLSKSLNLSLKIATISSRL